MKKHISEDSRGQAALEYLMTYGWAILVILVVGIALWQMGVFSPPSTPPGCSGFSQLMPLDSQLKGTTLTVILSNEAGTKLDIKNTNATIGTDTSTLYSLTPANPLMRPGGSLTATYTLSTARTKGEYYRAAIVIEYNNTLSKIVHKSSGYCWGTVE
jgi:hypothetical protein